MVDIDLGEKQVSIYELAKEFKRKYPSTLCWRIKRHANVLQKHLNPGEKVRYVFVGQKTDIFYDIISSCVVVLTTNRILIGRDRLIFGYFLDSVTPDMFNDLKIRSGVIWGKSDIDTINELITISHLSKRALDEIESAISTFMMSQKRKYQSNPHYHHQGHP